MRFLILVCLLGWLSQAPAHGSSLRAAPGNELFTNGPVLRLDVKISPEAMAELHRDDRKPVRAVVHEGTRVYPDVALHVKGAAGSRRSIDDNPALTLSFNKFLPGRKFHGLSKVHLNNSVQDPVVMDEEICGELFRAVDVPAARAAPVIVTLNGRELGVYLLKEGFSHDFLRQYFSRTDGNLYDGGFCTDIDSGLRKSSGAGVQDGSDLQKLVDAVHVRNPGRWAALNEVLEVDRFISMMVMETFTLHWDGYCAKANNYRVYFNPETQKFVFFVHGMDQMFGRGRYQSSIFPQMGGMVARAVMSTPEGKARYRQKLVDFRARFFDPPGLAKRVQELSAPIRKELAGQKERLADYQSEVDGLKERILDRGRDIDAQLSALSQSPPK